jgi:hypothetical protein
VDVNQASDAGVMFPELGAHGGLGGLDHSNSEGDDDDDDFNFLAFSATTAVASTSGKKSEPRYLVHGK